MATGRQLCERGRAALAASEGTLRRIESTSTAFMAEKRPGEATTKWPPAELWRQSQQAWERSRTLIEQSRQTLLRHQEGIAALRWQLQVERGTGMTHSVVWDALTKPEPSGTATPILVDDVVLGPITLVPRRISVRGPLRQVVLTPSEWQLLLTLVRNRGEVVTRSQLAGEAWGTSFAERHSEVEVYISRLRRKLARAGTSDLIETVRGQGYRLSLDEDEATPPH